MSTWVVAQGASVYEIDRGAWGVQDANGEKKVARGFSMQDCDDPVCFMQLPSHSVSQSLSISLSLCLSLVLFLIYVCI